MDKGGFPRPLKLTRLYIAPLAARGSGSERSGCFEGLRRPGHVLGLDPEDRSVPLPPGNDGVHRRDVDLGLGEFLSDIPSGSRPVRPLDEENHLPLPHGNARLPKRLLERSRAIRDEIELRLAPSPRETAEGEEVDPGLREGQEHLCGRACPVGNHHLEILSLPNPVLHDGPSCRHRVFPSCAGCLRLKSHPSPFPNALLNGAHTPRSRRCAVSPADYCTTLRNTQRESGKNSLVWLNQGRKKRRSRSPVPPWEY